MAILVSPYQACPTDESLGAYDGERNRDASLPKWPGPYRWWGDIIGAIVSVVGLSCRSYCYSSHFTLLK